LPWGLERAIFCVAGVGRVVAPIADRGGKSGLHRAGWWVTPTGGDPRESATENIPPRQQLWLFFLQGAARGVRVKRCGKSAPAVR